MRAALPLLMCLVAVLCAAPARANVALQMPDGASPGLQCRRAIRAAERSSAIPDHLLAAISHVESGRRDPQTGGWEPWPWTINAEGQGFVYDTKAQAVAAVRALQARGVRSIDVGCLQVNLMYHPDAFASLDQAFDPQANAAYAARFLTELFGQTNAWPKAAAMYHSATPEYGAEYQARVLAAWPAETQAQIAALGADALPRALAMPYGGMANGRVAVFLPPNRSEAMRIIPMGGGPAAMGIGGSPGRGLDFYRAAPVTLATRVVRAGG